MGILAHITQLLAHIHHNAHCREPPEPTGDEAEDEDLEAPKIYEPVSVLV